MNCSVASQMCHSKTRSSRGEVPWHSILWQLSHWQQLYTDSCHHSDCRRTRPVHWYLSPPLAKLRHVLCPKTAILFGAHCQIWLWVTTMKTSVFAEGQSEITRRSSLIGNLCHLVCFMVALLLVLELHYVTMCNLSWWVPCVDQPQKHTSKPVAWSNAYKCLFFLLFTKWNVLFCVKFIDTYIFKTTNNVNVYSEWVSFFSATL